MLCKQPKADINCLDSEERTPLMYAAECGNYDCAEVLLQFKANVLALDRYGCNALHYAMCALKQNTFLVRILCTAGALVTVKNKAGQTPLHLASKENRFALIPILLEHNAEIDATDHDGKT